MSQSQGNVHSGDVVLICDSKKVKLYMFGKVYSTTGKYVQVILVDGTLVVEYADRVVIIDNDKV